ncbi:DUF6332 family protein [Streptomyces sp. NPDC056937]|uniref:DUF6332 family protein n=1 Tax=Streptomyces sp. NPDC056937 TaxID=3345969 RepID=UPI003638FE17
MGKRIAGTTRGDAERDAITVEIGFAVLTGALAAALVYGVIAGPAWYFDLPDALRSVAAVAACLAFAARVVRVLWRFPRPGRGPTGRLRGQLPGRRPDTLAGQPSQPGRTSPDS